MRRQTARILLNLNKSLRLLATTFHNPQAIIPLRSNCNSSLYYRNNYYHSLVSPNVNVNLNVQRRFMSDHTCTCRNDNNDKKPLDEEKVNNLLSVIMNKSGSASDFDTIAESSEEYRQILLDNNFFMRIFHAAFEEIPQHIWDGYLFWVLERDDFSMDDIDLSKLIGIFTGPYMSQFLGADEYLYRIWSFMQKRRVLLTKEGVVTTHLLNHMLNAFSYSSLLRNVDNSLISLQILDMFGEFGCVPDFDSYKHTAVCLVHLDEGDSRVTRFCQDMGRFIRTHPVDGGRVYRVIGLLCQQRQLKVAHALYVATKDELLKLPLAGLAHVFYLIRLLSDQNRASCLLAVDMLADISSHSRNSKESAAAFSAIVIALCSKHNDVPRAKKLLAEMIRKGPPPGIKAFNALIKSLCLSGDLEDALDMLKLSESRGLKPDLGCYRLLIKGYKKRGVMDQASTLMSMATHKHPNSTIKV